MNNNPSTPSHPITLLAITLAILTIAATIVVCGWLMEAISTLG